MSTPPSHRPPHARPMSIVRYWVRKAVYATPLHRVLVPLFGRQASKNASQDYWDTMLQGPFANYLERTPTITARDGLIGAMLHRVCRPQAVLDVGCGGGSLAETLNRYGVGVYIGVDISQVAVHKANGACRNEPTRYPADTRFVVSDMRLFSPPPPTRRDSARSASTRSCTISAILPRRSSK